MLTPCLPSYLEELQSRERQHVAQQRTLRNQIEDNEVYRGLNLRHELSP